MCNCQEQEAAQRSRGRIILREAASQTEVSSAMPSPEKHARKEACQKAADPMANARLHLPDPINEVYES